MAATVITSNLINSRYRTFLRNRASIDDRYSSYDLCYYYFYQNRGHLIGSNLVTSCLQLWAFLSSWGMVARGNALQGKSYTALQDVITFINNNPQYYFSAIDSSSYESDMLCLYQGLKKALNITQASQKTVITKIMLGVYGCIPAFDQYVCETFGTSTIGDLTKRNIKSVVDLYNKHKQLIDSKAVSTQLLSFNNTSSGLTYTAAKVIDMVGFARPKRATVKKQ